MTKPTITILGIDLGKNRCSLAGLDATGAIVLRRTIARSGVIAFAATLQPCVIAMEACCGAHFLGRAFAAQGHTPRLMSPEYVQPYVKAQKTDDRDAEAIAEAATRPTMRFVSLKSETQLDLQALHRARERVVNARTSLINQLRAILLERGITIPKGRSILMRHLKGIDLKALQVSDRIRRLLADLLQECTVLDQRISDYDQEFAAIARNDGDARRLSTIPGIGIINATALVAAVGDGSAFAKGRDLAAWLGLTPRQHSTGGKTRILGISKRGNRYLRKQLIHGARAAMPHLAAKRTRLGNWLQQLLSRSHPNVVVVALAAKLARIVWAVLRQQTSFEQEVIA
jgi:transposase